jgi:hypothetical protein
MAKSTTITRLASTPPRLLYCSLLDHYYETARTSAAYSSLAPLKPALLTPAAMDPGFTTGYLSARIAPLRRRWASLRFAVCDLSGPTPVYAGHSDEKNGFVASIAKVAAMYAAFQLQYDLNVMAQRNRSLTTKTQLFEHAWREWISAQTHPARLPDGERIRVQFGDWSSRAPNPRRDASPNLENIFHVDESRNPLVVRFQQTTVPAKTVCDYRQTETREEPEPSVDDLPFYERMWLMIDESNGKAARSCILDLGYLYIFSSLFRSGLYDYRTRRGLWLSANYEGEPTWFPGPLLPAGGRPQSANPRSLVTMFTLLLADRLVSPFSSSSMQRLLGKTNGKLRPFAPLNTNGSSLSGSPLFSGLLDPQRGVRVREAYSKLGLGPGGSCFDLGAFRAQATGHGAQIAYVIAVLDSTDFGPIKQLAWEIQKIVSARP